MFQALGSSHGGFSSKLHAKVDALGLPLNWVLTAGQAQEITVVTDLLAQEHGDKLIADRAYDSDDFRSTLRERKIEPVIPGKKNRRMPIQYDKHIYKERNFVERFFNRIKQFRRIATRYDKTAIMFLGAITWVSILIWLKL